MPVPSAIDHARIAELTLTLLAARAPEASICPSEVARALAPEAWRERMPAVRAVAADLALGGALRITQGDATLDPQAVRDGTIRGPIRLRRVAPSPTA